MFTITKDEFIVRWHHWEEVVPMLTTFDDREEATLLDFITNENISARGRLLLVRTYDEEMYRRNVFYLEEGMTVEEWWEKFVQKIKAELESVHA